MRRITGAIFTVFLAATLTLACAANVFAKDRSELERDAANALANLYAGVRQWREAVRWLRQALEANPPAGLATWARLELARILTDNLGEAQGAVDLLQAVINDDSHNREALSALVHAEARRALPIEPGALEQCHAAGWQFVLA